jgi:hypothetical protein
MANTVEMNQQELTIQGLIGQYLAKRPTVSDTSSHLDEDTLSAFIEGNLNERQVAPVVDHLVKCDFCRHVSAELIRLDLEFTENSPTITADQKATGKISEVLSGLFSKIFGPVDGAVFAHNEDEKAKEESKDTEKDK